MYLFSKNIINGNCNLILSEKSQLCLLPQFVLAVFNEIVYIQFHGSKFQVWRKFVLDPGCVSAH